MPKPTPSAVTALAWLPSAVEARATVRVLAAGEALFRQGDKTFAVFAVERGRLRLIRHAIDSRPVVLHSARAGETFAEAALFAPAYQCDAVAAQASRVRIYPKRVVLAALRRDPALGERFMALLAHQIHALRARLEERNIRSATARVLHHIALAAGPDGRTMTLNGPVIELAAELGLSHEVLYRTLGALERAGKIARSPRAITLSRRVAPL